MKNFKIFLVIAFLVNVSLLTAQSLDCDGQTSVIISNQECVAPGSDFITFTMEVVDLGLSSANSAFVSMLPAGTMVTDMMGTINTTTYSLDIPDGQVIFEVPTTDCADVNFEIDIYNTPDMGMSPDCSDTPVTVSSSNSTAIPTMGQWGLIVLGLIAMSIGLLFIRSKNEAPALN